MIYTAVGIQSPSSMPLSYNEQSHPQSHTPPLRPDPALDQQYTAFYICGSSQPTDAGKKFHPPW